MIVGLGNPGNEYKDTRHNIGFMVVDNYLKEEKNNFKSKFGGLYKEVFINNEKVIILKPQKYINISGEVIKDYIKYFNINISDILIIHDDLDIEIGKYKLKEEGGSGGHNGIKNITLSLGTSEYNRLKIGISNNKEIDTKEYVLGKLSDYEKEKIGEVITISKEIIEDYVEMNFLSLMNKYN